MLYYAYSNTQVSSSCINPYSAIKDNIQNRLPLPSKLTCSNKNKLNEINKSFRTNPNLLKRHLNLAINALTNKMTILTLCA